MPKKPTKKNIQLKNKSFTLHQLLVTMSYQGTTVRALLLLVLFLSLTVLPLLPFSSDSGGTLGPVATSLLLFLGGLVVYDALYVTVVKAHQTTYLFDRWYLFLAEMASLVWLLVYMLLDLSSDVMNVIGLGLFSLIIFIALLRVTMLYYHLKDA